MIDVMSVLDGHLPRIPETRSKTTKEPPPLESFYEDAPDPLAGFRAIYRPGVTDVEREDEDGKKTTECPFDADKDWQQYQITESLREKGYYAGS